MDFARLVAVQMVVTVFITIFISRKLLLQNVALRNQLGVYLRTVDKRKIKSQIRDRDRGLWIILKKFLHDWSDYLVIVKPETVIDWERRRFTRFWRRNTKPKGRVGRPRISEQHIAFILRISGDHPSMGSQKIADELRLKFGIEHSVETIRKYRLVRRGPRDKQTWRTFIKNHRDETFFCDFLLQHTVGLRFYHVFSVMHVATRKIVHINVTEHPSLEWVKQQIREATIDMLPRFLIHDNDGIFGQFAYRNRPWSVDRKTGHRRTFRCHLDMWLYDCLNITGIPTPYCAPNANPHIERWHRAFREEALNHYVFFSSGHILRVARAYVEYYNHARPSQGIQAIPDPYPELKIPPPEDGRVVAIPVLGGLHHNYRLVA